MPIATISIVTPIVLTSCGSSNSTTTPSNPADKPSDGDSSGGGGGNESNGNTTQSYNASWKTDSTINGLSITSNTATITLDKTPFSGTSISVASKYADIVSSLSPNISSTKSSENSKDTASAKSTKTLYSVLSGLINNVDKFTVQLSIKPNSISFDFSNDKIGNTFSGQFILKPIADKNSATTDTTLNLTINNFDDSNNDSNKLTWNVDAIADSLKSTAQGTGNNLQEVKPVVPNNEGAAAIINLSSPESGKIVPTLSQVMNELSNTTISSEELQKFINNKDDTNYDLSKAIISTWAPTVDYKMVVTRIVIPNKDNTNSAIMYLAYTGYTIDQGNAAWNRNISYIDSSNLSGNLWDKGFNDPVIDLSKVNGYIGNTGISKESTSEQILAKADDLSKYIANNYIIGSENFSVERVADWDHGSTGKFNGYGEYKANISPTNKILKTSISTKESSTKTSSDVLVNNDNVIRIKFFLDLGKKSDGSAITLPNGLDGNKFHGYEKYKNDNYGFWKAFYIVGYKINTNS